MITVEELIEQLKQENPKRVVICQRDPEGNGYSPLSAIETDAYTADTTWSGERGLEELTNELRLHGYSEEDVNSDGLPALFLIPVN